MNINIYLSCLQSLHEYNIPSFSFWEVYFKKGIEEGGYTWCETPQVDWAKGLTLSRKDEIERWKVETWELVISDIKSKLTKSKIDIFLCYLYPQQIDDSSIKTIQNLGIPCVNFFCDNIRDFTRVPNEFKIFDLIWVPELSAIPMYKKEHIKCIHLPMPMWINKKSIYFKQEESESIIFIGSKCILRANLLYDAINLGLDMVIRGEGWEITSSTLSNKQPSRSFYKQVKNQFETLSKGGIAALYQKIHRRLYPPFDPPLEFFKKFVRPKPNFEDYNKLTRNSKICIGINRVDTLRNPLKKPLAYSRLRDIEAPMLGACYLTEWTEDIEAFYEIGKEIETYKSADELVQKVNWLSNDVQKRNSIRTFGQKRALNNHCVKKSIEIIFSTLK